MICVFLSAVIFCLFVFLNVFSVVLKLYDMVPMKGIFQTEYFAKSLSGIYGIRQSHTFEILNISNISISIEIPSILIEILDILRILIYKFRNAGFFTP